MADTWGIVTTVKAPEDQVMAFLAHHLSLDPARIWLHFDDPEDPSAAAVEALNLNRVTVIRCDAEFWGEKPGRAADRPAKHQRRQVMNLHRVYRKDGACCDWLAHIDVDEFLVLDRPLNRIFAECETEYFRAEPYEALHDPKMADDIFTSRFFHRATRSKTEAELVTPLFGRYAEMLERGMLSHKAGKCFFRTGLEGLRPAIHGARLMKERLTVKGFAEGIALLHFHAEDPERWLTRLDFRLSKGAYLWLPRLHSFLTEANDDEITDFYMTVMLARPELIKAMDGAGMLRRERLLLRDKVAALHGGGAVTPPVARLSEGQPTPPD